MFLFHDHHSDNPCKFSQVAEQTQQKGRRSINTLRLCLTSAKNGGQCHLSITYVCSKIIKAININQHSTEFLWLCTVSMPQYAPCRWPMLAHWELGHQLSQPGPAIIRGGWLSVTATCPIQGKLWSKISILIILTRKIRPEEVLPSQEQVAVMIWITCVLRPFESFESFELRRDLSQSLSTFQKVAK